MCVPTACGVASLGGSTTAHLPVRGASIEGCAEAMVKSMCSAADVISHFPPLRVTLAICPRGYVSRGPGVECVVRWSKSVGGTITNAAIVFVRGVEFQSPRSTTAS
jgi:hypothetical protein